MPAGSADVPVHSENVIPVLTIAPSHFFLISASPSITVPYLTYLHC
jgi:hypothetical protein